MNRLMAQILRFGAVGFTCFFIDFAIYTFTVNVLEINYLLAGVCGFVVSVVVNYILSMRFVFEPREDMTVRRQFIVFVLLSLMSLLLNEVILFLAIDIFYGRLNFLWSREWLSPKAMNIVAKLGSAGICMVFNFVTRKIFLEKKRSRM